MEDIYSGVTLYLIGYKGVGKKAIAKEISKLTGIKIIDDNLVYELISKIINKNDSINKKIMKYINMIREVLLDSIVDICRMQQSFIIMDELFSTNYEHKKLYDKVEMIAKRRGHIFIPIKLICEIDVLIERCISAEHNLIFDDMDKKSAYNNCLSNSLINIRNPNLLTLDTTNLSPLESAQRIVNKLEILTSN